MQKNGNIEKLAEVTSEAVEKATGSSWDEWIEFLEKSGANKMQHRQITDLLKAETINYWWRQKIASGYRLHKGLRGKGQSSSMFQAGVSKIFDLKHQEAWDFITSPEAGNIWNRGNQSYDNLNVFNPMSHMRLPYKLKGWQKAAVLQIRTIPKENKTTISLLLAGLPDEQLRNEMKQHLKKLLNDLFDLSRK